MANTPKTASRNSDASSLGVYVDSNNNAEQTDGRLARFYVDEHRSADITSPKDTMDDAAARIADNIQAASIYGQRSHGFGPGTQHHLDGLDGVDSDTASISTDVVNPEREIKERRLGRPQLPPIPDLRFQQSYLASISKASSWQHVAWITLRDQILLPLLQGAFVTLAMAGWRHWTRGARASGRATGLSLRQLWFKLTNWRMAEI
ncbi:hypothetical protein H112_04259 [Trichophyton rubrum D6]|uniref:DUF1770 domain-containing protein n=3 Tax=Trichophyton TaxID=5550 RepID=F2SPN7_TRIRC|nr:uncharacterized protein TERG_04035 [Trichophyton rubrum CBS 118892]EZF22745.1 hypothetical protein H100_04265 [Trichophyton rubrum MR850]EZF41998.1 hypothetical protein H102_04251 [Trichophyton rubrum CBS 100081]EZF52703.1 hypothetical protein H103_04259 [Trichophyton rubrum CBS 288.86]EZF63204.1 hypothetical protein H104_04249 [Trichophyton rubrum CBS 289.86]EZF73937.1 hypothetical protein H105_04276 [Trichophyton soudanense CBS 452.61]EZF84538.1 hypothetical protein H110_04253 [Trichophy